MGTEEIEIGGPSLEHASYGLPPILQKDAVAGFEVVKFLPLQIDYEDQVEATYTILKQHGEIAGGFNEDKPVPSLWYADIEALQEGMWKRIASIEERIEKRVLHRTRGIMSAWIAARCGLEPDDESRIEDLPVEEQARFVHFYRMVADGTPWPLIERFGSTLMPNMMRMVRFFVCMPQDKKDAKHALIDCRDGLLTIMRPYLLQWHAATIALNSVALQVPIYDLPELPETENTARPPIPEDADPFGGRKAGRKDHCVALLEAWDKLSRTTPSKAVPTKDELHHEAGGEAVRKGVERALNSVGWWPIEGGIVEYTTAVEHLLNWHNDRA